MTEETEVVDPQAQAADNAIEDFRAAHQEALYTTGHPEHDRRAAELKSMYERRYASEPNVHDPVAGQARPENSVDEVADEAMAPLTAEELADVIGPQSDFGLNVDTAQYGWDGELETKARTTFAAASLNGAQARTAALSYYETLLPTFNVEAAQRQ